MNERRKWNEKIGSAVPDDVGSVLDLIADERPYGGGLGQSSIVEVIASLRDDGSELSADNSQGIGAVTSIAAEDAIALLLDKKRPWHSAGYSSPVERGW